MASPKAPTFGVCMIIGNEREQKLRLEASTFGGFIEQRGK